MESTSSFKTITETGFFVTIALIISVVSGLIVASFISRMKTVPSGIKREGFRGPALGVSIIPCGQESSEARAIVELFASKQSSTEEGAADLIELKQILSKLCCMKHDLMAVSKVVSNTLYTPYNNSHDRENPADTVARCFTKSIPLRDLQINFNTWKERALVLISRLCTSYNFSSRETDNAIQLFNTAWSDVFSVAKEVCLPSEKGPETNSPRDPKAYSKQTVSEPSEYKGYY